MKLDSKPKHSSAAVEALVGVLVERAVVDLADVGHQSDGEPVGDLDALVLGLLAERVERELPIDDQAVVAVAALRRRGGRVVRTGVVIVAACRREQPEGEQRGCEAK